MEKVLYNDVVSELVEIPLWLDQALGTEVSRLEAYLPSEETRSGAAMVVCPGGGYSVLADHEAEPVARWLAALGIASFLLRYRRGPQHHHPVPFEDVTRAMRTVRARSSEWALDPARIGVLGFSAGGHLASLVTTGFDAGDPGASDLVERASSRPDLAVLIYPVITLDGPWAHEGSRANLLGDDPDPVQLSELSSQARVTPETPPVFLVHSVDDEGVPCENSVLLFEALRSHGVPCEMHLMERGGHGYGLAPDDPGLNIWTRLCELWLGTHGFLSPPLRRSNVRGA